MFFFHFQARRDAVPLPGLPPWHCAPSGIVSPSARRQPLLAHGAVGVRGGAGERGAPPAVSAAPGACGGAGGGRAPGALRHGRDGGAPGGGRGREGEDLLAAEEGRRRAGALGLRQESEGVGRGRGGEVTNGASLIAVRFRLQCARFRRNNKLMTSYFLVQK